MRCEIESAFIAVPDMAGLAADATAGEWPPAKRRWTRACEAEFTVYARDVEPVSLTEDPAFDPAANGMLSVAKVIIRPKDGHLVAVVPLNVHSKPGLPVSMDVTLRLAGQTFHCGNCWCDSTTTQTFAGSTGVGPNASDLTAAVATLDPQIKEADVILTPDPKAVASRPDVDRIWGKEIVFRHIPLARQDLPETLSR